MRERLNISVSSLRDEARLGLANPVPIVLVILVIWICRKLEEMRVTLHLMGIGSNA